MKIIKIIKILVWVSFFTCSMSFATALPPSFDQELITYIKKTSPSPTEEIIQDVIVLDTEASDKDKGKEFKTVRFTRLIGGEKTIITMKVEYGKAGVGPESEIISVINLAHKTDNKHRKTSVLYKAPPSTSSSKPKKKGSGG